jgi:hypothetical protein
MEDQEFSVYWDIYRKWVQKILIKVQINWKIVDNCKNLFNVNNNSLNYL